MNENAKPPDASRTATQMVDKTPFLSRNFLPAILVFTLPWLAEIMIFAGKSDADAMFDAPKGLLLNALYAAAPFFLMALAMRPRPRVSRALWGGAVITAVLWAGYGYAGRFAQSATKISDEDFITPDSGELFLWMFVILMIWPCVITVLMGVAAKFNEPNLDGDYHE